MNVLEDLSLFFYKLWDLFSEAWFTNENDVSNHNFTNETIAVFHESLIMFTDYQRYLLFTLNLIIMVIGVIGNVCVITINIKRKNRCMYKCCLLSLATADLFMATLTGIEHLSTLSNEMVIWHLGPIMCSFLPFAQIAALLVNSITLTCIAVDRYRTIVHAFQTNWNPSPVYCYIVIATIWIISSVVAYPMLVAYYCIELTALKINEGNEITQITEVDRCVTSKKKENTYYFGILLTFIFMPLLLTFLWLYFHIATLLWMKSKTLGRFDSETSTTDTRIDETPPRRKTNSRQQLFCKRNAILARKLRTFKVILLLMIIFVLCRLPIFIFMVVQMAMILDEPHHWFIAYSLNLISYVNCALNPFLYSFLNETISWSGKMKKICCGFVCTSGNDNGQSSSLESRKESDGSGRSGMVPRGPYNMNC